ncbi:BTAD domain-containing putative transcriptional regulator [Vallicoccus soli]|uniref:OmpR/PhoB-type domain-containing protein n=1 Tax=Vallicoccus soli TaxID=2339232 RepID=A0A3A3Z3W8_9ACTN|nr:BTAD domain-containing putative transcriptional regulator [Vallicoccus soli]RJK96316.1 hypothetical protein D5H78_08695 [Vallicoccus soli]
MRFRVLGPLEVEAEDGRPVDLGSPRLRALLTLLLVDADRVVPLDRITGRLWGEEPPASSTGTLQSYVSHLRRLLEPDRPPRAPARVLLTCPPGYRLAAGPEDVDALALPRRAEEGERLLAAGDAAGAEAALDTALALWRGEPYPDLGDDDPAVAAERTRLGQLRLAAQEHRLDAVLALGRPGAAAAELELLVGAHPLRERLWGRLMLALYRSGRQADALAAYHRCRRHLGDELGLDPGPELEALHRAVLAQDPSLDGPAPPGPLAAAAGPAAPAGPPGTTLVRVRAAVPQPRAVPPPPAPPAAAAVPDDLVGRAGDLAAVRAALAAAGAGPAVVVLLEGEPGIGKTRLAEAVAGLAAADGARVVWSRCAEDLPVPALWPWSQVVRELDPGAVPPDLQPDGADLDAARMAGFEALAGMLRDRAAQAPLLLVLEDLHAADPTSLQLLTYLVRRVSHVPLAVVATLRSSGAPRRPELVEALSALARERSATRLVLHGLAAGDVEQLLARRGAGGDLPALAAELHRRTEGNPFFLVELLRLLASEQGGTARSAVPASVRDVLERRLARLPEDTVSLLRLAAVAGREVGLDLLEQAADLGPERVMDVLEPAVVTGLLVEDADRWTWRFSHALVQDAIAATVPRLQRARLHRQVGEALERLSDPAAPHRPVEAMAHHFHRAGPFARPGAALEHSLAAADEARRFCAYERAAGWLERALDVLDRSEPGALRRRHAVLVQLGRDRRLAGDVVGSLAALGEAAALARGLGDLALAEEAMTVAGDVTLWNLRPYRHVDEDAVAALEGLVASAPADPARRARLLGTLAVELYYGDRQREGEERAREAVALARATGDPALRGRTLNNLCLAAWRPGRDGEREAATDEALALVGAGLPRRTELVARLHRAPLLLRRGRLDAFDAEVAAARRLTGELALPELQAQVALQECGRATLVGDWERVRERSARARELMASGGALWGLAWCELVQRATLARAVDGWDDDLLEELLGADVHRPLALLGLVEAGEVAEARRLVARRPPDVGDDWSSDFALACWGEVSAALGAPDPAVVARALEPMSGLLVVAGTANASWGTVRATLGRLAARTGDLPAARAHLRAALAAERALGAAPWAARTAADLAALG